MAIQVQFDKHGWYHPAFGRLGRGDKSRGKIYSLPDAFAEEGRLPSNATIIDPEELDETLEDAEQDKPIKPKVADEDALNAAAAPGAGRRTKTQTAQERTAPAKTQRRGSTKPKIS